MITEYTKEQIKNLMAGNKNIKDVYLPLIGKHLPVASIDIMKEERDNKLVFSYGKLELILPHPRTI